jgi:hypothetical protein
MKRIIYFLLNRRIFVPFCYISCFLIGGIVGKFFFNHPFWESALIGAAITCVIVTVIILAGAFAVYVWKTLSKIYSKILLAWEEAGAEVKNKE